MFDDPFCITAPHHQLIVYTLCYDEAISTNYAFLTIIPQLFMYNNI